MIIINLISINGFIFFQKQFLRNVRVREMANSNNQCLFVGDLDLSSAAYIRGNWKHVHL